MMEWGKQPVERENYLRLRAELGRLFLQTVRECGLPESDFILQFFHTAYGNGADMMDGNPLFSAKYINGRGQKILKIVINEDSGEGFGFDSCFDGVPMHTLVVSPLFAADKLHDQIRNWFTGYIMD